MPTNIYDVTQPLDTQLANLLGLDLRNLALNVQERMGLISGLLAGRWNPATDTQPLNWTGLLYFATDTGQLFRWSGAAWADVTSAFFVSSQKKYADLTNHVLNITAAGFQTGSTITIPVNDLHLGSIVRVHAAFSFHYTSGPAPLLSFQVGTQTPLGAFSLSANTSGVIEGSFSLVATNSEIGGFSLIYGNTGALQGGSSVYADSIDVTANVISINILVQGFSGCNSQLSSTYLTAIAN